MSSISSTSCGLYKLWYCVLFFNSHVEDTTNVMVLLILLIRVIQLVHLLNHIIKFMKMNNLCNVYYLLIKLTLSNATNFYILTVRICCFICCVACPTEYSNSSLGSLTASQGVFIVYQEGWLNWKYTLWKQGVKNFWHLAEDQVLITKYLGKDMVIICWNKFNSDT